MKKLMLAYTVLSYLLLTQISLAQSVPLEKHFKSLKQLTFEGTSAEAYFSGDSSKLVFQGRRGDDKCDQVFTMDLSNLSVRKISKFKGRNTCAFFMDFAADYYKGGTLNYKNEILYSSTFKSGSECPTERDKSKGYIWEIFNSYDIFSMRPDGTKLRQLTKSPGYDAESTVCGGKIVFTSARSKTSLQIYTMDYEGKNLHPLTSEAGYNGGPFFSQDCKRIVYRAYHPKTKEEAKIFRHAVQEGYVPPGILELYTMNANGSQKIQLTELNAPSFAPSFFPKNDKIIFSSSLDGDAKRSFHLYSVSSKLERQKEVEKITTLGTFNGFPMFSPNGKHLVFASNRNSIDPHVLHLYLAEWQE